VFCDPTVRAHDDRSGETSILQGWFGRTLPEARWLMEGAWRNDLWAEKVLVPFENVTVLDKQVLLQKMGYSIPHLNALLVPNGG
jgi:hypothetical protein